MCYFKGVAANPSQHGPILLSNYIRCKIWHDITNPFPNFNGATVVVVAPTVMVVWHMQEQWWLIVVHKYIVDLHTKGWWMNI